MSVDNFVLVSSLTARCPQCNKEITVTLDDYNKAIKRSEQMNKFVIDPAAMLVCPDCDVIFSPIIKSHMNDMHNPNNY